MGANVRHNPALKPIASGKAGHSLPDPFLVGPSLGAQRRIWGLPGLPVHQSGRCEETIVGCAFSVVCRCKARSVRGYGGSVWNGYCVEFDFSQLARGKLASPGTARIIYRELANQTQQSNLTFPSSHKFLQLGVTMRQTNLLAVPKFPPACVASETVTPYEIS